MDFICQPNKITLPGEGNQVLAEVTFPDIDADTVNIDHTFVDASLGGRGIAGKLMECVTKQLQSQNKKAVLTCSYAV